MTPFRLITIGYAKQALVSGSREQRRMESYAKEVDALHVIVFTRKEDALPSHYTNDNLHIYGTNTSTRIGMMFEAYRIGKRILKNQSEEWVVSSQDPFETSIVGRALARARHILHHVQLHGDFYGNSGWVRERFLNRLRAWYGRTVLRRAFGIRVVSYRIKRSLHALGIPEGKITVLPIHVSLEPFLNVGVARTYEEKSTYSFIFVGRLAPEKNITALIDACTTLCEKHTNFHLSIVGEGPEREKLQRRIEKSHITDYVSIEPWTKTVSQKLKKADVFVLPSLHEGYGLVLIEAMAAGMPVITTNVGCVGEVVMDNKHGTVTTEDSDALQKAMLRYLETPSLIRTHGEVAHSKAMQINESQKSYAQAWKASFEIRGF